LRGNRDGLIAGESFPAAGVCGAQNMPIEISTWPDRPDVLDRHRALVADVGIWETARRGAAVFTIQ
jgi:hypothetical protein